MRTLIKIALDIVFLNFVWFAVIAITFAPLAHASVLCHHGRFMRLSVDLGRRIASQLRGLMDKASAYGAEDCGFKSHRGCSFFPLFCQAASTLLIINLLG